MCFVPIDFVGIFGGRIGSVDETQSVGGHQLFVGIIGVVMPPFKWGLLVCNGHYVEPPAVEMQVGKVADCLARSGWRCVAECRRADREA